MNQYESSMIYRNELERTDINNLVNEIKLEKE